MRAPWLAPVLALLAAGPALAQQQGESKWGEDWRERVATFRTENAALPAGRKNVVFVGDSMTEGFPLEASFPGRHVLNRGIVADTIGLTSDRGILGRLDECVVDTHPSVLFVLIGVNDLASSGRPVEFFLEGYGKMLDAIAERAPGVPIIVQTCLPSGRKYERHETLNPRIKAYNEGLRALAKKRDLPLIDLEPLYSDAEGFLPDDITGDGLHLKRAAYARWAEAAAKYVP